MNVGSLHIDGPNLQIIIIKIFGKKGLALAIMFGITHFCHLYPAGQTVIQE